MANKNITAPTTKEETNETIERKFKIIEVKEITAKNGNKFTAYKTIGKGGRKLDVKFTRDCKLLPTEPCTIVVAQQDANVDTSRVYPCLWIKNVLRIETTERKSNLDDFFDTDGVNEGEPF